MCGRAPSPVACQETRAGLVVRQGAVKRRRAALMVFGISSRLYLCIGTLQEQKVAGE
jgi:hypothetical protein